MSKAEAGDLPQPVSPSRSSPHRSACPHLVYTPGVPSAAGAIPASQPAQPLRSSKGQELLELLVQHLAVEPLGKARLISEFWIPVSNARADLVVANGVLDGSEIKATSDRLHRLPSQVVSYRRIFDHC